MAAQSPYFRLHWLLVTTCFCHIVSADGSQWLHSSGRGFLERPRVSHAASLHQEKVQTGIDWSIQNRIPPWMSNIEAGSSQGVAIVLGQSLKPDGTAPKVLLDRALKARELLDTGKVFKVIVTGGDPAGVGHTEASEMAKVLMDAGIPKEAIIQESQATTTAENAWFSLRWIPKGTGQFYIVTSDFHMPRATYIFEEVFNYFYQTWTERYKDDPEWKDPLKQYPRLELHQATVASFCDTQPGSNRDDDPRADINDFSLRKRALDELGFLGSRETPNALYGQPLDNNQIWPIQINVTQDPQNEENFRRALAQSMNTAKALCICVSPPEGEASKSLSPLRLPASTEFPDAESWKDIRMKCEA